MELTRAIAPYPIILVDQELHNLVSLAYYFANFEKLHLLVVRFSVTDLNEVFNRKGTIQDFSTEQFLLFNLIELITNLKLFKFFYCFIHI